MFNLDSSQEALVQGAARRATLIMRWRAHPDVVAYINDRGRDRFTTWDELRDDAVEHEALTWGVCDLRDCYHWAAAYGHGLNDADQADRAIIRAEHGPGGMIDASQVRWLLVRDIAATCPVDLPSRYGDDGNPNPAWPAPARAWAAEYRAALPEALRHFGMIVALTPGQSPVIGIWIGVPQSAATLRSWIARIDADRFEVVRHASGCEGFVAVEPRTAIDVRSLAARPTTSAPGGMLRTGIAELDAQLRLGGIPDGSLVVVQGGPKACKTTTELQLACAAREQGADVVVIAGDESPVELHARLWQRQGLDPAAARERALRGEHADARIFVVDPREHALQRILDAAAADPAVRLIVAESLQTLAPGGQHEIDALLVKLRATGKTVIAASEVVGGPRGRRAKGSTSIGYQASLTLDVVRKGDEVTITPVQSRLGSEEPITLTLDADRQQLTGAAEADAADALEPMKAAILSAIRERGPLSGAGVERWVRGRTPVIRGALEALLSDRAIVRNGAKYALPT